MFKKLLFFSIILFFVSCATKKDVIYSLNKLSNTTEFKFNELLLQKGDIIDIKVSSINPEATLIFQQNQGQIQNQQGDILKLQGYLIDAQGEINFPIIGSIEAAGLNTSELSVLLKSKLEVFIKEPSVKVRLVNYKITVLGEVNNPGTFTFLEEQITLPQVLGTAGDLTISGDRTNIILIRKIGDELQKYLIDLTQGDLINPDYFYLQQNDVVYIPPNTARVKSSGIIGNVGTLVSVLSLLVSLTILITR